MFRSSFPLTSGIISFAPILLLVSIFSAIVLVSFEKLIYASSLINIAIGLLAFRLEKRILDYWPVPLTTWMGILAITAGGLGPLMIELSQARDTNGLLEMQIGIMLGVPFFLLGFAMIRPNSAKLPPIRDIVKNRVDIQKTLHLSSYCCLAIWFLDLLVQAITGRGDRGISGESVRLQIIGPWVILGAFQLVGNIGFALLPVSFLRNNFVVRALVFPILLAAIIIGIASGSRTTLLTPPIFFVVGYFSFVGFRRIKPEIFAITLVPVFILTFPVIDAFRDSDVFQETRLLDPIDRVSALVKSRDDLVFDKIEISSVAGARLVGVVDNLVYSLTPSSISYAYLENFDSIIWIYVPYTLYQNRPVMQDGKAIAERYLGRPLIGTSISISLPADWYRRFGWPGVAIGMLACGLLFGAISQFISLAFIKSFEFGLASLLCYSLFFIRDANGPFLTVIWYLFYRIPTQIALLVLIFFGVRFLVKQTRMV